MAEIIETQEEEFEAADITQETQEEQPQEEVAQEEVQQETVEDLPPKYKGKSLDEIIKMHQEALPAIDGPVN